MSEEEIPTFKEILQKEDSWLINKLRIGNVILCFNSLESFGVVFNIFSSYKEFYNVFCNEIVPRHMDTLRYGEDLMEKLAKQVGFPIKWKMTILGNKLSDVYNPRDYLTKLKFAIKLMMDNKIDAVLCRAGTGYMPIAINKK